MVSLVAGVMCGVSVSHDVQLQGTGIPRQLQSVKVPCNMEGGRGGEIRRCDIKVGGNKPRLGRGDHNIVRDNCCLVNRPGVL